jgi:hypothetical protein
MRTSSNGFLPEFGHFYIREYYLEMVTKLSKIKEKSLEMGDFSIRSRMQTDTLQSQ